jgi:hypothetical protein
MTRFIVGVDRSQRALFPERSADYLGEDNPVRAVDVFVDGLGGAGLLRCRAGGNRSETTSETRLTHSTYAYGKRLFG